ncbi:hypothetical protein PMI27_001595 [Pseudomonas sp. GM41(2012)]|nr:hypothetical protein PMI27_001595 [Pseudomonas sp. GM41(2012)]
MPLHSVPRLGSACPHSGIAPGARRHRPSMAGGGYRGILAAVPPAQYLRSASGKGASRSKDKAKAKAKAKARSTALQERAANTRFSPLIRPSVSSPAALDLEVHAPSRGRVEVLRSGQPGMDAGLAAPGHGWPMAAGPRSRTGARACRATARHRTKGARAFGYLGLFQVTRCKSGTISRRDRRNGYTHKKQNTTRPPRS